MDRFDHSRLTKCAVQVGGLAGSGSWPGVSTGAGVAGQGGPVSVSPSSWAFC